MIKLLKFIHFIDGLIVNKFKAIFVHFYTIKYPVRIIDCICIAKLQKSLCETDLSLSFI